MKMAQSGALPITDPKMTRFNISLEDGVEMVLWGLENSLGGELLVPKIPSYRITDMAEAIGPNCKKPIMGIRPGEKIHEEMVTASDSFSTIDLGSYYAILPSDGTVWSKYETSEISAKRVEPGFAYNSGTNPDFLSVNQIRDLIREHVDSKFEPI
jgi:FlaA1/EpsC-like NDP-sugar epimerase